MHKFVVGLDEVGRGSLSGPCAVGAFLVEVDRQDELLSMGVKDSKKLTEAKRNAVYEKLRTPSFHMAYQVHYKSASDIDKYGLTAVMDRCVESCLIPLIQQYDDQIVEIQFDRGLKPKYMGRIQLPPNICVVEAPCNGEDLYPAVAAASIMAKVERDRYMTVLGSQYPSYGFENNKGYGSKQHRDAIRIHGRLPGIHRDSFL